MSALPLVGPLVTLRAPREEDAAPLVDILAEPEVSEWWVGYDEARVRADCLAQPETALAIGAEFAGGATRVTLDPNINNAGAIRSYERLGFRRIGVLRDYQRRPGGHLDDALFLDLTRRDFPDGPPLPVR